MTEKLIDIEKVVQKVGGAENFRHIIDELQQNFHSLVKPTNHKYSEYSELADLSTYVIGRGVLLFIDGFKPMENAPDNYDLTKDIIGKATKHMLPKWKMKAFELLKKTCSAESIYDENGNISKEVDGLEGESMEEKVLSMAYQESLQAANRLLLSHSNLTEVTIINGMLNRTPVNNVVNALNSSEYKSKTWNTEKVNHLKNLLEFRLGALYYVQELVSEEMFKKMIKKNITAVKYYFGVDTLEIIPDKDYLRQIAIGKMKIHKVDRSEEWDNKLADIVKKNFKESVAVQGKSFAYKSKYDFYGKKHSNFVTFINYGGHAYCHAQNMTKNIMREEVE